MAVVKFVPHVLDGLVQAQTRFYRDHHQVQGIGQREADRILPLGHLFFQYESRENPPRGHRGSQQGQLHHGVGRHAGFEHDAGPQNRQDGDDFQPVEHRRRTFGTVARPDQLRAQVGGVHLRRRHVGTDLPQQRDDGAGLGLGVDGNGVVQFVADHRSAELFEKLAGLVEYPVAGPRHEHHQRHKCESGQRQWMIHIKP